MIFDFLGELEAKGLPFFSGIVAAAGDEGAAGGDDDDPGTVVLAV